METVRAERAIAQRTSLNDVLRSHRGVRCRSICRARYRTHPSLDACPECGGELRKFGEDVSEMLEYVPSSFKVVRHAPQAELPRLREGRSSRSAVAAHRSRHPRPGLLAHVLVAKYADRLPLYRQSEFYAEGVDLDRSTSPTGSVPRVSCYARLSRK